MPDKDLHADVAVIKTKVEYIEKNVDTLTKGQEDTNKALAAITTDLAIYKTEAKKEAVRKARTAGILSSIGVGSLLILIENLWSK